MTRFFLFLVPNVFIPVQLSDQQFLLRSLFRVTASLEHLEMSGNFAVVRKLAF